MNLIISEVINVTTSHKKNTENMWGKEAKNNTLVDVSKAMKTISAIRSFSSSKSILDM